MAEKKRGLGAKGLGINALINTEVQDLKTAKSNETVTELDLDLIEPNRKQPRKYFDETALEDSAHCCEEKRGILRNHCRGTPLACRKNRRHGKGACCAEGMGRQ